MLTYGKKSVSTLKITKEEGDDNYTAVVKMEQSLLGEEGVWEARVASFTSKKPSIEEAVTDALLSEAYYLESCDGDLFSIQEEENDKAVNNEIEST